MKAEHIKTGNEGETIAAQYLRKKGYEILHLNWRTGRAEVDIIARIGTELVFVEVKTRNSTLIAPEKAVNKKKKQMLAMAANAYGELYKTTNEIRFDIIGIVKKDDAIVEIIHFEDAFFPFDDGYIFNEN